MTSSYQLAVIGSGAAGREAAILAARNGLRVVLIEQPPFFNRSRVTPVEKSRLLPDCDELISTFISQTLFDSGVGAAFRARS
jgi:flavin-dependent dehydrogenase